METSPEDDRYNCVAWAAGDTSRWWWPVASPAYWPQNVPRCEDLEAFEKAFEKIGYSSCSTQEYELGAEKVAIYAKEGKPTHAARQLDTGHWTSKIGESIDIQHHTLSGLEGECYGSVALILSRSKSLNPTSDLT